MRPGGGRPRRAWLSAFSSVALPAMLLQGATALHASEHNARLTADQPTFHGNAQRSGWYAGERLLRADALRSGRFGLIWESEPLGAAGDTPPRLFASPLYLESLPVAASDGSRQRRDVVFAASTTGFVAAINATDQRDLRAGATLWQRALTTAPCARGTQGILSTPVIDRARARLYVVACDAQLAWRAHALDLATGDELPGWPVAISSAAINAPGINGNGDNRFPDGVANLQRGALNLSADSRHLFVTFGAEPVSGWLVALDTQAARIASAFSMTARTAEGNGGLWSSGGVALDRDGKLYVATGSSVLNALAGMGNAGVYPDSDGNWSQSILQFSTVDGRLRLTGSYTPFNYCQAGGQDIDLGAGTPIVIDLPPGTTATPRLLLHGGSKQGNVYLLDRARLPGSLVRRQPCAADPQRGAALDGSLLAPEPQPAYGTRGPLNVFGPYTDRYGMGDIAKSRTTPAYFRAHTGQHFAFVTGSAKAGEDSGVSIAPSLVRLELVAARGRQAYPRIDAAQPELVFQNPGSPVVSSRGKRDGIVWVLDVNKPRSASLYGPDAPAPVLYAVDAHSLALLWRSPPGQLYPGGKYNDVVIARGRVFVGTDRIQAFGLRDRSAPRAGASTGAGAGASASGRRATERTPGSALVSDDALRGIDAAALYAARCGACHDQQRADVPARAQLAARTPEFIIDKMAFGSMQAQALGLDDAQLVALARWLAPR
jgi:mono/diheme cytochrome c family protein